MKRLSRPRARSVVLPAVLALTGTLALTGCGDDPRNAAVVNGEAITVKDAQTVAHEYNELTGQTGSGGVTPDKTLAIYIEGHFALKQQRAAGQGVSADDARRIMEEQVHMKHPSETLVEFYRRVIAVQAARQDPATVKKIQSQLEKADITINPRYGDSFDVKQRTVVAPAPDWIKPVSAGANN